MGTFQKYSPHTQWVFGGQFVSELAIDSPCTHWVNAPLPPVWGPFQSVPVLRAFSTYFASYGIRMQLPSQDPGRPIGALALAAAAVSKTPPPPQFSHFFPGRAWVLHAQQW